jgi:hypothetical protein
MPEQIEKEVKKQVLERVPPGDRWKSVIEDNGKIYPSLTDGLQYVFETQGQTEFHIDARAGVVFVVKPDPPKAPPPPKTFSLYGDE